MSEQNGKDFNQQLFQIVSDLWGNLRQDEQREAARPDVSGQKQDSAVTAPPPRPADPVLEEIWQLTDESVDWTEALTRPEPTDAGCDLSLWHLYHSLAERVLHGDTDAYQQVLEAARPLDDLRPYAHETRVEVLDADSLRCECEIEGNLLNGQETRDRWIEAALAVRMGRDLLAALPVQQVEVNIRRRGEPCLQVTFNRGQMQRVHFAFVDPAAFVEGCGGAFLGEEKPGSEISAGTSQNE